MFASKAGAFTSGPPNSAHSKGNLQALLKHKTNLQSCQGQLFFLTLLNLQEQKNTKFYNTKC